MQEVVGSNPAIPTHPTPLAERNELDPSGCGAVWLARSLRMREDVGSNPAIPIPQWAECAHSIITLRGVAQWQRVRFGSEEREFDSHHPDTLGRSHGGTAVCKTVALTRIAGSIPAPRTSSLEPQHTLSPPCRSRMLRILPRSARIGSAGCTRAHVVPPKGGFSAPQGAYNTGCGAVWLARSLRMREDVGSNPAIPIPAHTTPRDVAQWQACLLGKQEVAGSSPVIPIPFKPIRELSRGEDSSL